MRGAYVSWCALFTQRQPPSIRQERANVSRSLSFSLYRFYSVLSFSLIFRISFSPSPLEYWCGQASGTLWDPSSDSSQSGAPYDDFIMKKRNVRVDRTPLQSARDGRHVRLRVSNVYHRWLNAGRN